MRIFITGGAGFIGSHVVEHLHFHQYHDVLVYDNLSSGRAENLDASVRLIVSSINEYDDLETAFLDFKPDMVVHLAAQPAITLSWFNPKHDLHVNASGTLNLLRLCTENKVQRLIFASTSAVYAETMEPMFENFLLLPTSPYGISKMAAERYVMTLMQNNVVLRLGNVFGPRQIPIGENQVIPRMIRHFEHGEPFFITGDGEQRRDFIYVKDVARAISQAMVGKSGIYNIASGNSISINDLARCMETIYELPGYAWEHNDVYDPRRNACLDIEHAKDCLNWIPYFQFESALRDTIEWWKQIK